MIRRAEVAMLVAVVAAGAFIYSMLPTLSAAEPKPAAKPVVTAAQPDARPISAPASWSDVGTSVNALDDTKMHYITAGQGFKISIACYGRDFYVRIDPGQYLTQGHGEISLRVGSNPAWRVSVDYKGDYAVRYNGDKFLAALLEGETEGQRALFMMANYREENITRYLDMTGAREAIGKLQQRCPENKIPSVSSFANDKYSGVYPLAKPRTP